MIFWFERRKEKENYVSEREKRRSSSEWIFCMSRDQSDDRLKYFFFFLHSCSIETDEIRCIFRNFCTIQTQKWFIFICIEFIESEFQFYFFRLSSIVYLWIIFLAAQHSRKKKKSIEELRKGERKKRKRREKKTQRNLSRAIWFDRNEIFVCARVNVLWKRKIVFVRKDFIHFYRCTESRGKNWMLKWKTTEIVRQNKKNRIKWVSKCAFKKWIFHSN